MFLNFNVLLRTLQNIYIIHKYYIRLYEYIYALLNILLFDVRGVMAVRMECHLYTSTHHSFLCTCSQLEVNKNIEQRAQI